MAVNPLLSFYVVILSEAPFAQRRISPRRRDHFGLCRRSGAARLS
jgi:hypothetical protein